MQPFRRSYLPSLLFVCATACGTQPPEAAVSDLPQQDAQDLQLREALAQSAQSLVAYDDQPENGFTDAGWGNYQLKSSAHVYSGRYAMQLVPSNYDGVQLRHAQAIAAGTYQNVDFWIHGGSAGGQVLWVGITTPSGGSFYVPVSNYLSGGKIAANAWQHVVAPLKDMKAASVSIQSVYVMAGLSGTQGTVYIDQVSLTSAATGGTSTTTTGGSGTTTGGSSTTTTTGGSSTTTGGGSSSTTGGSGTTTTGGSAGTTTGGSTTAARESWAWVYYDYIASTNAITSNAKSFTHVSPTFYSINYSYSSGVASYSNCTTASGTYNCTNSGTNNFTGYTTQSFTAAMTKLGLATVPAIYAGSANGGSDAGVINILNNPNTVGAAFISAMVQEAVTNGYAGYNLDWELGSAVGSAYATPFVNFVNAFKVALKPHNMSLSVDAIVSNINGTWCSGNDGFLDFAKLSASSIDRVIIEDYTNVLGTASTTCVNTPLSSTSPASCPLNSAGNSVTATGLFNFMCSNLPASMVVIGLESYSGGTNPIAGQAVSTMQSYGFNKIALWPQAEGSYPFLSGQGFVATQSDWYSLLVSFLAH